MTTISGASDDLIELQGDFSEEHGCYFDSAKGMNVSCSDGTKLRVEYNGNWNITVKESGTLFNRIVLGNPAEEPHTDKDCQDCSAYSDVVVLNDGIEWVKIGRKTYKK